MSKVRETIENRFSSLYNIDLSKHMKRLIEVEPTSGLGLSFEPNDHRLFREALRNTKKFHPDNGPYSHGDIIGAVAAAATDGEGWREEGLVSLHCAIAPQVCRVHIDEMGFSLQGTAGKYSPELVNHIVHDLGWGYIIEKAYEQSSLLGDVLSRVHPHFLSGIYPRGLGTLSPYRNVGVGLDLIDAKNAVGEDRYRLTIDFSEACTGPRFCGKHGPVLSIDFAARVDWDRYVRIKKK